MAIPDENVNPMDHFKDNFGQNFGPKRGSEVKTNSAVSFVSDMLDIKEKFDPQMFNSVAYRRTMSILQEYNDVKRANLVEMMSHYDFMKTQVSKILKITN